MKIAALFGISLFPARYGGRHRKTLAAFCRETSSAAPRSGWTQTSVIITNPVLSVMESSSSMGDLKQIQGHMVRTGMIEHGFPVSRLLAFCALSECGDLDHARRIFSQISEPNAFMWNAMIRGYHWRRSSSAALDLFRRMLREDADINDRTFVFVLKVCESLPRSGKGECIHSLLLKLGLEYDLLVRNALMHFYVSFGFISSAMDLFDRSSGRDVVSWTTMIDAHTQGGYPDEALQLFRRMMVAGGAHPNEVTMITVLSSCSQLKLLNLGRSVHGFATRNNTKMTGNFLNALIDMYGKAGDIASAGQIFAAMEKKDVFSWTIMINAYARSGNLKLARQLFDGMPERNAVTWSAMIAGYSQSGDPDSSLELFSRMQSSGVDPIEATLLSVLSACAQSGRLEIGRQVRHYITSRKLKLTKSLGNAFIDMYAKCGAISEASEFFSSMPEKDLVSWNSLILGYAVHGQSAEALALFEKMKLAGEAPDGVTFLGILSACSHGRLVTEGRKHFQEMKATFSLRPSSEHYACMVNLLGRVGLLAEAVDLIESMAAPPDRAAWGALLHACRIHGETELGKMAAQKVMDVDPNDSGAYMLLTSLCAARGEWEEVKKARKRMREGGVKKAPGRSSIEVDGEVSDFFAGSNSHSLSKEIYRILELVYVELGLEVREGVG